MDTKKDVMIIDGLNLFIRSYSVDQSITIDGINCGGIIGSLNCIKSYVNKFKPKKVFICWDGQNGSIRKRSIYKEYKQKRKPYVYKNHPSEESDNKLWQLQKFVEYLKFFPICQIYIDNCEADDVIYYLSTKFKDLVKVIVTSDKDLFQMIDDNTVVYSLARKQIIDKDTIVEKYNTTPGNFVHYKSFLGDPSDNIPGIKGIGDKKFKALFPFLAEEKEYSLEELKKFILSSDDKKLKKISKHLENIEKYYRLIKLDYSQLSLNQIESINDAIKDFSPQINILEFRKKMIQDKINILYKESIISSFRRLLHGDN